MPSLCCVLLVAPGIPAWPAGASARTEEADSPVRIFERGGWTPS
jgi:hypothetical protein